MISNQTIRYRAKVFSDVLGQPQVTTILKQRAEKKDWPTATLLYGPTGTGKTTVAYLMAMAINCRSLLPDGNSCLVCPSCRSIIDETFIRDTQRLKGDKDGGKGDVQEFLMEADSRPLYDKKRIFIIEESDQLSTAAKNSLHTILESPKKHVHFILLSMVPNGIPKSLKDRCQTSIFNPLGVKDIMDILRSILEKNNLWTDASIPKEFKLKGLGMIASASSGSARDAIQTLEQCIMGSFFTPEQIQENIEKISSEQTIEQMLYFLLNGKKEDFYTKVSGKCDLAELIKFGYNIIARAIIYKATEEADYESKEKDYKALVSSPNFGALANLFRQLSAQTIPYLKFGDFILSVEDYFQAWKLPMRG